ncbi:uncharacterized protein TNCV_4772251 [Trichonephila clavipes]|nr:uncharacterized protein TNCV_4772251 [Trichonephila clavipes]
MRNARGFNVLPEVYFPGLRTSPSFWRELTIKSLEIPSDLSCAYLKGHLLGRALDWYQIFGSINSEEVRRPSNGRNDYRANYENSRQGNQWFESRNRFQNNDRGFKDREYQFRNGGQNDDFSRGDPRNRGSSENFSRGDRRQRGRLNVLKVSDKGDQRQSINEVPIKLSAICMPPVELPYVPILLNEIFTKALWDTGAEKSFISEETYRKYFFYKPVQKSRTQVITAQGAKCQNIGVVELNIRIREFLKNLGCVSCVCRFGIPMYAWDRFHRWIKDYFGL